MLVVTLRTRQLGHGPRVLVQTCVKLRVNEMTQSHFLQCRCVVVTRACMLYNKCVCYLKCVNISVIGPSDHGILLFGNHKLLII